MENVTDLSFNNDEVVPGAKPPEAAQPMVVVQYRHRGVPWWLLLLLTVFVPVCAILIYDALFMGRYRAQAVETAEALRTRLDGAPRAESKKSPEADLPLALNSQPIPQPATPAPPASPAVPASGAAPAARDQGVNSAAVVAAAGPVKPDARPARGEPATLHSVGQQPRGAGPARGEPARAPKAQEAASPGGSRSVSLSAKDRRAALDRSPFDDPSEEKEPLKPVRPGAINSERASSGVASANERLPALDRSPFDDPGEESKPLQSARPGETNSAGASSRPAREMVVDKRPVGEASGVGIPPAQQPLPTKEEMDRQLEAEAAHNQAELQDQLEKKTADLRSSRYQERVKFREELRAALQQPASLAGPEIDALAKRYSYDADRDRLVQATNFWRAMRKSQAWKVEKIRSLELPETVILNFLSDEFHAQVRTRNGPRNENEVRIRAAHRLLELDLPPEDAMPAALQPADSMPGRTSRPRASPSLSGPVQRGR